MQLTTVSGIPILLSFIVLYIVVVVWIGQHLISMPMVFLAIGVLAGVQGLGLPLLTLHRIFPGVVRVTIS
jgi:hypothetical protein